MSEAEPVAPEANVEVILHCLNTSPEEHVVECEEERWLCELGERPALYMAMATCGKEAPFIFAMMSWAWRDA